MKFFQKKSFAKSKILGEIEKIEKSRKSRKINFTKDFNEKVEKKSIRNFFEKKTKFFVISSERSRYVLLLNSAGKLSLWFI